MKDKISSWIMGAFAGLLGLVGLAMSAGAKDLPIHGFGLAVFVFAVFYNFWLIKRSYDQG